MGQQQHVSSANTPQAAQHEQAARVVAAQLSQRDRGTLEEPSIELSAGPRTADLAGSRLDAQSRAKDACVPPRGVHGAGDVQSGFEGVPG